jgi:hypothetical protein
VLQYQREKGSERERESCGVLRWGARGPRGGARYVPSLSYTSFQGLCSIFVITVIPWAGLDFYFIFCNGHAD